MLMNTGNIPQDYFSFIEVVSGKIDIFHTLKFT